MGRVAGEIGEHRFWPGEGRLDVDKPVLAHKRCEVGDEGFAATQPLDLTKERQPSRRVGIGEGVVRLTHRDQRSLKAAWGDHTAATAFRHSLAASARKIRSVDRETRWR